jgi:preprotein translocase subunit SecB
MSDNLASTAAQPVFAVQRIYTKDISFEAPQAPAIFQQEWNPEVDLKMQTEHKSITDDVFEVMLKTTVTAKSTGKTAFLAEVQLAGIFTIQGFPQDQFPMLLNGTCPNILFPYVREVISDLVNRGTFPPLYLAPVNFDAIYLQQLQQNSANKNASESIEITH